MTVPASILMGMPRAFSCTVSPIGGLRRLILSETPARSGSYAWGYPIIRTDLKGHGCHLRTPCYPCVPLIDSFNPLSEPPSLTCTQVSRCVLQPNCQLLNAADDLVHALDRRRASKDKTTVQRMVFLPFLAVAVKVQLCPSMIIAGREDRDSRDAATPSFPLLATMSFSSLAHCADCQTPICRDAS